MQTCLEAMDHQFFAASFWPEALYSLPDDILELATSNSSL